MKRITSILSSALLLACAGTGGQKEEEDSMRLSDFGIRASNLFFYYEDLAGATEFYTRTLGMELVGDYGMASILRVAKTSYLILVKASEGMHSTDEPKTVALALVTDELEEWYLYLKGRGLRMRNELNLREGSAHDGFVAYDPEGYLLEFERFNAHPENARFLPLIDDNPSIYPARGSSDVPAGLGFKASVTWQYYKDLPGMQRFYEEVLGLEMVADQGWTKIYQGSASGFVGLVDESRGMHRFTQEKAVTVSFIIDDLDGWFDCVRDGELFALRSEQVSKDDQGRYQAFVGYDPENYFMEFDRFFPHDAHPRFYAYLNPQ
ncbi:MAG: VOC family protein [Planctomycetota bacterium]|jgi:catechol 2,3-dioxygenase-like lactoylglutathione lyase family enzyme